MQENMDKDFFKRSHPSTLLDADFFTSNSSSNDANQMEIDELLA